jgi:hypothetical protein
MNLCNNPKVFRCSVCRMFCWMFCRILSDLCRIFGYCQLNVCLIYFKFILFYVLFILSTMVKDGRTVVQYVHGTEVTK